MTIRPEPISFLSSEAGREASLLGVDETFEGHWELKLFDGDEFWISTPDGLVELPASIAVMFAKEILGASLKTMRAA